MERAKEKIERLHGIYLKSIDAMAASEGVDPRTFCRGLVKDQQSFSGMSQEEADLLKKNADDAYNNIKYVTDMEEAFGDADFVIEAMAENPQAKIDFLQRAGRPFAGKDYPGDQFIHHAPQHICRVHRKT